MLLILPHNELRSTGFGLICHPREQLVPALPAALFARERCVACLRPARLLGCGPRGAEGCARRGRLWGWVSAPAAMPPPPPPLALARQLGRQRALWCLCVHGRSAAAPQPRSARARRARGGGCWLLMCVQQPRCRACSCAAGIARRSRVRAGHGCARLGTAGRAPSLGSTHAANVTSIGCAAPLPNCIALQPLCSDARCRCPCADVRPFQDHRCRG